MDTAQTHLADREGMGKESRARYIGHWTTDGLANGQASESIGRWATALGLDGVVWTNLPPRFDGVERVPSVEEVVAFLRSQPGSAQQCAEEYVRKAPRQIDTAYRRHLEEELGWTPIGTL